MEKICKNLVKNLEEFFKKNGFKKAVIGVSGGIDSAVTLKIAVKALGAGNVSGLIMPEEGLSSNENIDDAKELCDELKVKYYYCPINKHLSSFVKLPWKTSKLAKMNLKPRIRMILLYNFANSNSALVLGTSNKSEIMLGYGTKFGDLAADVEVIGSLYKTEVYGLARYLKLSEKFIVKKPTAELKKGQFDEDEMGISYEQADEILQLIEKGKKEKEILKIYEDKNLAKKVLKRYYQNKHKTDVIPRLQY